jgi:hypothetical protein|nr:hypothetical protein [Geothrix sp.]
MVDGILEDTGDRTVVFRGYEQQALGCGDLGLQAQYQGGLMGIILLAIERQILDLHLLEYEIGRRQFDDGVRSLRLKDSLRSLPTITAMG